MHPHEREVTLKLNSRPLRLVYLVRNREDLVSAVKLYTHVWGGMADAILPIPKDELEIEAFFSALKSINPDYILTSAESIPDYVYKVLKQLPILQIFIRSEKLEEHINGLDLILLRTGTLSTGLHNGRLSHIRRILGQLHPTPTTDVPINFVEPGGSYGFELGLLSGFPSQSYQDFLKKLFNANTLSSPQTTEQVIKSSLLLSGNLNPAFLSINQVKLVNTEGSVWMVDEKILHLFLLEDEDINVACTFWNYRRFSERYNKLVFKQEDFLKDIKLYAELLIKAIPTFELLFVSILMKDEASALALGQQIQEAFSNIKQDIVVKVFYQNFRFNLIQGVASFGQPTTTTQAITSDYSIRFSPSIPPGHENTEFIFSFDAEVTLASGRKLFMPPTLSSAILLSNRLERIEYAKKHQDSQELKYLRGETPVRSAIKGTTGTTLAGKEARIYIPTDGTVISQQIRDAGLVVKLSEHTKYTQGCIKRLGGFQNALTLLNQKGADILSALVDQESDREDLSKKQPPAQKIAEWTDIRKFLLENRRWKSEEISNLLTKKLLILLSTEFVNRGYPLECSTCNFKNWYSIDEVKEIVECKGCTEKIQIPLDKQFSYKLNELAYQVIRTGGLAVLMTASILYKIDRSSFIEFGGKLFRSGEGKNFVEIDLFCLAENAFILAECKSINKVKNSRLNEKVDKIKEQLEQNVEAAILLNAQVVILGVASEIPELPQLLLAAVEEVSERAAERQIGVHLILNWKLYLWGRDEIAELWRIHLEDLRADEQNLEEGLSVTVGKLPTQGIRGGSGEMMNYDLLKLWKEELSLKGIST
jgi:hypothetical protein